MGRAKRKKKKKQRKLRQKARAGMFTLPVFHLPFQEKTDGTPDSQGAWVMQWADQPPWAGKGEEWMGCQLANSPQFLLY